MDTVLLKKNLKSYYNQEAELRNKSDKADWKIRIREDFCSLIRREKKKTLLEIGAGAGYDSEFFMNKGLEVIAVDMSREMVRKCKEKTVEAYELDFYNLYSLNKRFECIWAMNTLLHVPKSDLHKVLQGINLVLEEDGLFFMGVYGGEDFEGEYVKSEVSNFPRFFSYHSKAHLKATLENYFKIVDFEELNVGRGLEKYIFQSIIMRKK